MLNFKNILIFRQTFVYTGLTLALSALGIGTHAAHHGKHQEVNLYSARQEALIKPLLDSFTKETGIKVNLVTGKGDALLTRLTKEGKNSPADVLLTTDVGRLYRAKKADVLQPQPIPSLKNIVPEHYRDSEHFWVGLSLRARAIIYDPKRTHTSLLSSYEALADPKWKKKICIRSSSNIYNQSLVASMIEHHGKTKTSRWLKGLVGNFARPPQGGDRDQIKAVAAGQCELAVVNSYYFGAMLSSDNKSEKQAASGLKIFWPNQKKQGVHMNISGAGITKASKNTKAAIKLIEHLTSKESQAWYAKVNNEFPVRDDVETSNHLKVWGEFKRDSIKVEIFGKRNAEAVMLMDIANWK